MAAYLENLFHTVLTMSLTAAMVIACILLVRLSLKKVPKAVSSGLWFVALFRLLCPFSFTSSISFFGLFGSGRSVLTTVPANIGTMLQPEVNAFLPAVTQTANAAFPAANPAASFTPLTHLPDITLIVALVWALGGITFFLSGAVSYLLLKRKISTATLIRDNIYRSDQVASPFVCGLSKPKIYLPLALTDTEREYIIRHEQIHIRRRDYLVKSLWFLAVCIHWFNPLAWLSFSLMSKDMEMSCDEAVIHEMGESIKTDYSSSLLALAVSQPRLTGSPLAFGEGGTLSRVKNVLKYKRPVWGVIVAAVLVVAVVSAVLAANPKDGAAEPNLALQFLKYQTPYVGNNSKVGNIIALLPLPEGVRYDSFALKTDIEPYEITVNLKTDPASQENYLTVPLSREQLETDAVILFALVNNVEVVTFSLPRDDGESFVYSRILADERYGRDVREFARSEEELAKLLSGQAPLKEPVQIERNYALLKLGPNGEVLATRSPLSGEEKQIAEDIIFNALIKSTLYRDVDIGSLDNCYLIRATYTVDGSTSSSDYYAFLLDGTACLQAGNAGYSRMDDKLYQALEEIMEEATHS